MSSRYPSYTYPLLFVYSLSFVMQMQSANHAFGGSCRPNFGQGIRGTVSFRRNDLLPPSAHEMIDRVCPLPHRTFPGVENPRADPCPPGNEIPERRFAGRSRHPSAIGSAIDKPPLPARNFQRGITPCFLCRETSLLCEDRPEQGLFRRPAHGDRFTLRGYRPERQHQQNEQGNKPEQHRPSSESIHCRRPGY